jgi:7-keto-8-aminopelargonate synthetase-like enzyme
MAKSDLYAGMSVDKSLADKLDFNPYYRRIGSGVTGFLKIKGETYINLASNNYLGLACDSDVKSAIARGAEKYGASMCGTPIATGTSELFTRLEESLADFCGLESSVLFPSCYQANAGLFPVVAGKEDLIIVDHYAHASLIEGIKASGSKMKPFLHNNMEHLEKLLGKTQNFRRTFVVTESVFSTEGSIAPLDAITDLCRRYNAIPVVDDSHGIGVIGDCGRGVLEAFSITDFPGIYTASLGKALANSGGVVAGKTEFIDYLRYTCPGLIYSTALTPASISGILAVLDIIRSSFHIVGKQMWKNKTTLTQCLKEFGLELSAGQAPITSIVCGSAEATILTARALYREKILSTPFIPPSVPPNQGRVRLIAGADLDDNNMEQVTDAIKRTFQKSGSR